MPKIKGWTQKQRERIFAPLANILCELGDDPDVEAEMEKDFERWAKESETNPKNK